MSPRQGHHATGLCSRFPPIPLSHLHHLSIEQEAHAEPPPAVKQLTTANPLSPFQPSFLPHSNSPHRLTTYCTIVPGVVRAIEEVLNDLVGGGNIYLVDIVNLQPRGDREGGGGDGSGSGGGDKRRRHLNIFN